MKPLPTINNILFVDNSFLDELACPRKLEMSQLMHLISADEQHALTYGSAVHEVLEYRGLWPDDPNLETNLFNIATKFFEEHPAPEGDHRHLNHLVETIQRYNSRYGLEMFEVAEYNTPITCPKCNGSGRAADALGGIGDVPQEPPTICMWCRGVGLRALMVELPFTLPLCKINTITLEVQPWTIDEPIVAPWLGVMYSGRIDEVLRQSNNRISVMDHKTDSTLGPQFFDRYRMSSQMIGYCWALWKGTGIMPWGFVVNGIRSKGPTAKMLNGTATAAECNKWWGESFFRGEEHIDPWHIEEWERNTIERIRYLVWRHGTGYMPKESKECARYGKCPFYDVCYMPPDQRQTILDSTQFKINTWSPLNQPAFN